MYGTDATSLRLRQLESGADERRWDEFVLAHPEATFFHRAGWKRVLENSLGHRAYFLIAEDGTGAVCGVLPLASIASRLFGRSLISTPFCVYGGPVATTVQAAEALTARAVALAEELGVGHLEFRSRTPSQPTWLHKDSLYATFRKPIDRDPEKNLLAIPRKQRAMVRKGMKLGLTSEIDPDPDRLHAVYAESVRNLGTPVFPRRYFRSLAEEFGRDCQILTVLHEGRPVSAVMSFFFRDEVLPYYGGGTAAAREVAANDFMYWEVMRRAAENGCGVFDFGRSKFGTGAFDFKKFWGFAPEPLHYEYRLVRARELPEINPLNPKYRTFIALWKKLPLPVANLVGPILARDLG